MGTVIEYRSFFFRRLAARQEDTARLMRLVAAEMRLCVGILAHADGMLAQAVETYRLAAEDSRETWAFHLECQAAMALRDIDEMVHRRDALAERLNRRIRSTRR